MSILVEHPTPPALAFEAIAGVYDDVFSNSPIGRAQRRAVWNEMDREFREGQSILEINCGTGIDALHLASRGVRVDACDSAPGMIARAQQRADLYSGLVPVRFRCLSIEETEKLTPDKPYDGVLSNFSGLNCVAELQPLVRNLTKLVRPGGRVVLCVFGTFCLWEVLWYLRKGDARKALRRVRRGGAEALLAPGAAVKVRYRSVRSLRREFSPHFRLIRCRGVGVAVPPSYAESIPANFPRLFRLATAIDPVLGRCAGFRSLADHVVLIFERVGLKV